MNFDEWAVSGGLDVKKFPMLNIYKDADTRVASVAWQEQQAKIDILQIKLNGADERAAAVLNHKNKMIDELQARVDGALKILDGMRHNGAYRAIDILKGNKDEN